MPNFTVGNWGSTNAGFTMRTGLAELIYLHPFGPLRFADMLLSPSGFPSRLVGCPRRCLRSQPPAPVGQSHVRRFGAPQLSRRYPRTWSQGGGSTCVGGTYARRVWCSRARSSTLRWSVAPGCASFPEAASHSPLRATNRDLRTRPTQSSAGKERQGSREHALAKFPWLAPVAVELFGGVINPAKLHFPFNHMPAGDARDWTAIHAWSDKLAATFLRPVPPVRAQAQAVQ